MRNVDRANGLTGRAKSFLVGAVVVLLTGNMVALAAHDDGSSAPSTEPALLRGDSGMMQSVEPPTGPTPTTVTTVAAAASRKAARSTTSTAPTTTSSTFTTPTTWPDGYVYQVEVQPTCAAIGQEFTITFHLKPRGGAVLIATYADGQTYNTWHANTAKEDGLVVYKWKAPPAPGTGTVHTQASDPEAKRRGQTNVDFRIVEVPGAC